MRAGEGVLIQTSRDSLAGGRCRTFCIPPLSDGEPGWGCSHAILGHGAGGPLSLAPSQRHKPALPRMLHGFSYHFVLR